jgi:hypothetical protein
MRKEIESQKIRGFFHLERQSVIGVKGEDPKKFLVYKKRTSSLLFFSCFPRTVFQASCN